MKTSFFVFKEAKDMKTFKVTISFIFLLNSYISDLEDCIVLTTS